MSCDYKTLEVDMLAVLAAFGEFLTLEEDQEVHIFIDASEYGVAFEALCSIIKEESKPISASAKAGLLDLGERMEINSEYWRNIDSS